MEEKSDHSGSHSPVGKDVYTTESETHTPSKEEMETNEKNLMHNASYLGQLIFKLRWEVDGAIKVFINTKAKLLILGTSTTRMR